MHQQARVSACVDVRQQAKLAAHGLEEARPLVEVGIGHPEYDRDVRLVADRGEGADGEDAGR
jgi:hypothetical protein